MGLAERIFKGVNPVWKTGVMSRYCPLKVQRGRLASYTVKSRDGDAITGFVVNTLGEITGITATLPGQAAQSIASNISYQPFGGLKVLTWGNGLTLERSFDNDYRLSSQSISGSQSIQSLSYQYDPISNITAINDSVDISNTGSYEYDLINRLSNESKSDYQNSFSYDAVGNRTGQTQVDLVTGVTDTQSHTYGTANNRLITRNTVSQSYDEVGNILNNGTTTFSYDVSNRMADASQGGTTLASYTYNALGQRSAKTRPNSSNQHSTAYLYNPAGQLISETTYNSAGVAQETKHYVWLGTVPVAMLQPAANDADHKVIYLHTDHLDTPRKATDQNQNVVWQWQSDAFGTAAANDDPDGDNIDTVINLRFPGQYFDQETGLHYNYFRDYDPGMGRYVQSDPIGLGGGVNTFGYALGNPVIESDGLGLCPSCVGAILGGGIEIAAQIAKQLAMNGGDWGCVDIDWADVGISMVIGAVAPSLLGSAKTLGNSRKAKQVLKDQLRRARTKNRRNKIRRRLNRRNDTVKSTIKAQAVWQSAKALGKAVVNDGSESECGCKK